MTFSKSGDEGINIGMAIYPHPYNTGDHSKFDYKTLVYRIYNGDFYGLSGGTKTYRKAHKDDVIKFTFDAKNRRFSFKKVILPRFIAECFMACFISLSTPSY